MATPLPIPASRLAGGVWTRRKPKNASLFIHLIIFLSCLSLRLVLLFFCYTQDRSTGYWLGIFSAISASQAVFALINLMFIAISSVQAAKVGHWGKHLAVFGLPSACFSNQVLHSGMLRCLLRVPMSFFNSTPLGRITNRFSKDMADVCSWRGEPKRLAAFDHSLETTTYHRWTRTWRTT